jgi:arginine/lysine/ornithine decarboxylase
MHTPGHQGGLLNKSFYDLEEFAKYDLTELPGLGNLFSNEGPIYESEIIASKNAGSKRTLYFTQGATSAIYTIITALGYGKNVLVPLNAHISVMNALILSGAKPIFYNYKLDHFGLCEEFNINEIKNKINSNIDLVIVQNPTYEGKSGDLKALKRLCEDNGAYLLVDEAHGAHYTYDNMLPESSLRYGLDFIVQSPHKTLPAMTGAALLHINREELVKKIERHRRLIHSTSPSYLILASLDALNEYYSDIKDKAYKKLLAKVKRLYDFIDSLKNTSYLKHEWVQDFTKLTLIFYANLEKVSNIFIKYGIIIEKRSNNTFLLLLTPLLSDDDMRIIENALCEVELLHYEQVETEKVVVSSDNKEFSMSIKDAFYADSQKVMLSDAIGTISSNFVYVYPPGVPILIPGERIEKSIVSLINNSSKSEIVGVEIQNNNTYLEVIK